MHLAKSGECGVCGTKIRVKNEFLEGGGEDRSYLNKVQKQAMESKVNNAGKLRVSYIRERGRVSC